MGTIHNVSEFLYVGYIAIMCKLKKYLFFNTNDMQKKLRLQMAVRCYNDVAWANVMIQFVDTSKLLP